MSEDPDGAGVAPVSDEVIRRPMDVVDMEKETVGGGASTGVAGKHLSVHHLSQ